MVLGHKFSRLCTTKNRTNITLLQTKRLYILKFYLYSMEQLNFVCKIFTIEDLLKCSFGLNKTELQIMKFLLEEKEEKTIEEIIKIIKKDRTTVQRAVKKLFEKDLIKRRQINLKNGGYVFVYSPKAKAELKEKVYKIFEAFKESVGKEIHRW